MEKSEIIRILSQRSKGQLVQVVVDRPAKVKKAFADLNLRKVSSYALQLAQYANRAPVKASVENLEREAPETPSWVYRVERHECGATFWHHENGKQYLALPVFGEKAKSHWLKDGIETSIDKISEFLLASETAKRQTKSEAESKGQALFNAILLENIASIK